MRQTDLMFRFTAKFFRLTALALTASLGLAAAIRITVTPPVQNQPVTGQPALSTPTDPYFSQQWNLRQIGLQDAWATTAGADTTVAVLDTGYVQSDELSGPGETSRASGWVRTQLERQSKWHS